jgi:hypothetical protein
MLLNFNSTFSYKVHIDKVELWVNGVNTGISDNVEPYSLVWITTAIDDGSYTITVRAYDVSENTADSEPITLIVDRIGEECETYYSEYVTPILSQNCYSCHSGSAPSGGLNLSTYESVLTSMETILDRVNRDEGSSGFMPSGGSKLSVSDLSSLQTFLEMDCE